MTLLYVALAIGLVIASIYLWTQRHQFSPSERIRKAIERENNRNITETRLANERYRGADRRRLIL